MEKANIIRLLILIIILLSGIWLSTHEWSGNFSIGLGVLMGALTGLWLLSLTIKDCGIIDIFWGTGFVIIAWLYAFLTDWETMGLRNFIFLGMVTLWGLRLSIYLAMRNIGKPEDYRYAAWREENGKRWWWFSFFKVFTLQGILLWIISAIYLPIFLAKGNLEILDYVGIVFWAIGLYFEAVGDWQMMCFKKYPINKGKVMDQGLWKYTRHPNYFGDSMVWWGFFFFSLAHPQGIYFIICPIIMTFFLVKVSGVVMLEEGLKKTKPGYEEYVRKTAVFIPWWPRK